MEMNIIPHQKEIDILFVDIPTKLRPRRQKEHK